MHQRFVTTALAATWYYLYVSCLSITCAFSSSRPSSSADVLNVPEIMALIQRTYPLGSGTTSKQQWAKTRNYLYHYRANSKQQRNATTDRTSVVRTTKRVRTKHLSLETVQQIIHFLETNFPKDRQLQAHILQTSPRILSHYHSIESRLLPTMELLRRLYGNLPDRHGVQGMMIYEAIWRNTNLLLVRGVGYGGGGWEGETNNNNSGHATTTMEEDSTTMNEYLMNDLGVSSAGISKLKQSHPALFQVSLNQTVKPVVQFLRSIFQHRSKPMYHPMARIITNHPMLFHLDVDTNLAPKARFLQSFCGMNDKELADVIATTPGILGVSLEHNLRVTLQFLLDALTIDSETNPTVSNSNRRKNESIARLKKCLVKHPQILGLSLENLSAKLSYFDQLDQRSNHKKGTLSSRILLVAPSTYSLSLTNLAEKIQYLAAIWDCEAASLSDHLRVYPQILTLSMEGNIKPTMAFYNMSGYIDLTPEGLPQDKTASRIHEHTQIKARYIATSLYNRLLPRWYYWQLHQTGNDTIVENPILSAVMVEKDDPLSFNETKKDLTKLPPLHLLAGASDEVFCKQMGLSLNEYHQFKKAKSKTLKFNQQFEIWLQTGRPILIDSENERC